MIDVALNLAVFAALLLCIAGFSAWARKRVPCRSVPLKASVVPLPLVGIPLDPGPCAAT